MIFYKYSLVHCDIRTYVSRQSNIYSTFNHWSIVNKHLSIDNSEVQLFRDLYISFTSKDSSKPLIQNRIMTKKEESILIKAKHLRHHKLHTSL